MTDNSKRTIKRIVDIIITILTALVTSITTTSCIGHSRASECVEKKTVKTPQSMSESVIYDARFCAEL